MSKLCLTVTESSIEKALEVIGSYRGEIDIVELRLDYLENEELKNLDKFIIDEPAIVTYRKEIDGGNYTGSDDYRIEILKEAVITGNFSFIDLEEDLDAPALEALARDRNLRIIRSFHDFNGIPDNLADRMVSMKRSQDEIPKAAVFINSSSELLEFYKDAFTIINEEKILLGMGNYGFNTRILAEKIGSYLTYSSKEGNEAAPGHASPDKLNSVYRFREIERDTPVMGIIGNPVMHTKSPIIHNNGYRELNIPGVYVPFETDKLEEFLEVAKILNLRGFSVTVPFKNDIIALLDSVSDSVRAIGACNTVYRKDEYWVGENSDYIGFINPLKKSYGDLKGKNVTVIGAGGAAKAAVYALKEEGAQVLIVNRTVDKAKSLAGVFDSFYEPLNSYSIDAIRDFSDIIIQTTNVGMHPMEHINPLSFYPLTGKEYLYDIIYTPEKTNFLKDGELKGCRILNGWEMLLEQGYMQFKLFTGYDYPLKIE